MQLLTTSLYSLHLDPLHHHYCLSLFALGSNPQGVNDCGPLQNTPSTAGGWCSPTTGDESKTHFDTSAMYMASGYLNSTDGSEVEMDCGDGL